MPAKSLVRVEVDRLTLRRLQAKLTGRSLYGDELRRTLTETVEEGADRVQSRAPLGQTFALWGSVDSQVQQGPFPTWAKITADASNRGFRYGWALQAAKKITYRYRHGTRAGRPTRRWFSGTRPWIRKRLQQRVARMKQAVESRWRR